MNEKCPSRSLGKLVTNSNNITVHQNIGIVCEAISQESVMKCWKSQTCLSLTSDVILENLLNLSDLPHLGKIWILISLTSE